VSLSWEHELRALRDHDRAHAPPFASMLAPRSPRARRTLLHAGLAAAAAVAAVWLAWPRQAPDVTVAPSAWRSPTAALLAMDFASTRSPTASLARPLALPEKLR
jgi:ferric-dicitrate binding protein FerR (iron transport regulator)